MISPSFSAMADEVPLPVYAVPVYVADGNRGALHSFAAVDVALESHQQLCLDLTVDASIPLKTEQVFAYMETALSVEQQAYPADSYRIWQ